MRACHSKVVVRTMRCRLACCSARAQRGTSLARRLPREVLGGETANQDLRRPRPTKLPHEDGCCAPSAITPTARANKFAKALSLHPRLTSEPSAACEHMDVPELPVELIDGVFEHLSVFGLYDCRTVCRSWLSHASRARNAKGVLMVVGSCGGKLGRAKSIHPCVRGKIMFPVTGLCGFGDGFLLAADTKRHRLLVVQTTPATAELVVHSRFGGGYYGSDPSPHPLNFCSPQSVLHCRTDGRDVFYTWPTRITAACAASSRRSLVWTRSRPRAPPGPKPQWIARAGVQTEESR